MDFLKIFSQVKKRYLRQTSVKFLQQLNDTVRMI